MREGGGGFVFGRNIWRAGSPDETVAVLVGFLEGLVTLEGAGAGSLLTFEFVETLRVQVARAAMTDLAEAFGRFCVA